MKIQLAVVLPIRVCITCWGGHIQWWCTDLTTGSEKLSLPRNYEMTLSIVGGLSVEAELSPSGMAAYTARYSVYRNQRLETESFHWFISMFAKVSSGSIGICSACISSQKIQWVNLDSWLGSPSIWCCELLIWINVLSLAPALWVAWAGPSS